MHGLLVFQVSQKKIFQALQSYRNISRYWEYQRLKDFRQKWVIEANTERAYSAV